MRWRTRLAAAPVVVLLKWARDEAREVARGDPGLPAKDLAALLEELARRLEAAQP